MVFIKSATEETTSLKDARDTKKSSMTIEEKKAYLNQYRWIQLEERELNEELECLRLETLPRAIEYSDMPKAHNTEHDLSDHIVRLEEVTEKIESLLEEKWKKRQEISKSIEAMENPTFRLILRYRYLSDKRRTPEEIAELIGYSDRNIYYMYHRALELFEPIV